MAKTFFYIEFVRAIERRINQKAPTSVERCFHHGCKRFARKEVSYAR